MSETGILALKTEFVRSKRIPNELGTVERHVHFCMPLPGSQGVQPRAVLKQILKVSSSEKWMYKVFAESMKLENHSNSANFVLRLKYHTTTDNLAMILTLVLRWRNWNLKKQHSAPCITLCLWNILRLSGGTSFWTQQSAEVLLSIFQSFIMNCKCGPQKGLFQSKKESTSLTCYIATNLMSSSRG